MFDLVNTDQKRTIHSERNKTKMSNNNNNNNNKKKRHLKKRPFSG